jgi:hypothetical protein
MTTSIDDVCWGNWLQSDHLEIVSDVLLVTEQPNPILGLETCLMVCVVARWWNQCYMDLRQLDDDGLIPVSQRHVKMGFWRSTSVGRSQCVLIKTRRLRRFKTVLS